MYCENCGASLRENAKFCDQCGRSVGAEAETKKYCSTAMRSWSRERCSARSAATGWWRNQTQSLNLCLIRRPRRIQSQTQNQIRWNSRAVLRRSHC